MGVVGAAQAQPGQLEGGSGGGERRVRPSPPRVAAPPPHVCARGHAPSAQRRGVKPRLPSLKPRPLAIAFIATKPRPFVALPNTKPRPSP